MRRRTVAGLEALEERRTPQMAGQRTAGSSARSVPLRRDNRATPSGPRGSRAPGPASPRAGCRGPLGRIGLCRNAMEPRNQAGALPPARMSWRCRRTWERAGSTPDGASSRTNHAHSLQRTCGPTSLRGLTLLHTTAQHISRSAIGALWAERCRHRFDLEPFRRHYPDWDIAYDIGDVLREIHEQNAEQWVATR